MMESSSTIPSMDGACILCGAQMGDCNHTAEPVSIENVESPTEDTYEKEG